MTRTAASEGGTGMDGFRPAQTGSLARGYRRLLACYPAWYRRLHEDEMLAVLMTDAPSGKRRPGIAEAADLVLGALRIRCQPSRTVGAHPAWRDALAVLTVIVPLIVLLSTAVALLQVLQSLMVALPPGETRGPIHWNVPGLAAPLVLAALVLLGLRMRRLAALGAAGLLIVVTLSVLPGPAPGPAGPLHQTAVTVMVGGYSFLLLGMEILALSASPGPRRGLQILTWKHWAFAVIATLLAVQGVIPMTVPVRVAVVAVISAALALASSLGRWLLLLLAVPVYPFFALHFFDVAYWKPSPAGMAALYLPSLALAVLAIAAARRASLRPA